MEPIQTASTIQIFGGLGFGALIGWYVYYINRHRKSDVQLSDLATLVGVLGGAAILALFPAGSDLFGAYGVGLFLGFFGYFVSLIILVGISKNFDADWFLDGRRRRLPPEYEIPAGTIIPMGAQDDDEDEDPIVDL
jgi:hypothetical protein